MNASVTSTDRLKLRSRAGLALGVDEGFDVGMVAAQRGHHRAAPAPADMIVRHIASHTSMKLSGPDASAPTPFTGRHPGRSVEKSCRCRRPAAS